MGKFYSYVDSVTGKRSVAPIEGTLRAKVYEQLGKTADQLGSPISHNLSIPIGQQDWRVVRYVAGVPQLYPQLITELTPDGFTPAFPLTLGNVKSLLHFEGNLTDECGHSWSAVGGAAVSSDWGAFGSGSLLFSGAQSQYISATHNDFVIGTGDFTFDCRLKLLGAPPVGGAAILVSINPGAYPNSFEIYVAQDGSITYFSSAQGLIVSTPGAIPFDGTAVHIAATRAGGTGRLFINGILSGTASDSANYSGNNFWLGKDPAPNNYSLNGYVDEVRLVVGEAVWTDTFTPPSSPYAPQSDDTFDLQLYDLEKITLPALNPTVERGEMTAQPSLGSELVVNGGFDDASWWSSFGSEMSISGGALHFAATQENNWINRDNLTTVGKTYRVQFTISNYVSGAVKAAVGGGGPGTARSANGTYTEDILCANDGNFYLMGWNYQVGGGGGSPATCDVDNVSVKEVLPSQADTISVATPLGESDYLCVFIDGKEVFDWTRSGQVITLDAPVTPGTPYAVRIFKSSPSFIQLTSPVIASGTVNAEKNTPYCIDTSSEEGMVILPANPAPGTKVLVADAKRTFDVHRCLLGRNGSNIQGVADDYELSIQGTRAEIVYIDTAYGWVVYS